MTASESMGETLGRMLSRHGETVTLWRSGKGLSSAAEDGFQSPVPRHPVQATVLFSRRSGAKRGGTGRVYVDADTVEDHSLTSPESEWAIQRAGEQEQMPVSGGFSPVGSGPTASWWSGDVGTGGGRSGDGTE